MKFKIGDCVIVHNSREYPEFNEKKGIVVCENEGNEKYVGINFGVTKINGRNLHRLLDFRLPERTGWYIREEDLKLIKRKETNIGKY
jgi:hypothetical protein